MPNDGSASLPAPIARRTPQTRRVLRALAALPRDGWTYGQELSRATGLSGAAVQVILSRLAAGRWVERKWESTDEKESGRPARRYYRLTRPGRAGLKEIQTWLADQPPSM